MAKLQPFSAELQAELEKQLRLNLALDEPEEAVARGITPEEAHALSRVAERALDERAHDEKARPTWWTDYGELREGGFPWRVAAYIAWLSSPRVGRWPETQAKLAQDVLGLRSDRILREWRKENPAIEAAVSAVQAKKLFEHRADVFSALVASAADASYRSHPDRKLFFEMSGDYVPRSVVEEQKAAPKDLSEYSDAELAEIEKRLKDKAHAG